MNNDLELNVLAIVRETYRDLHGGQSREISLDAHLDRDLGLDSLARLELLSRIARAFDIELSETILSEVDTPRDLIAVLRTRAPTISRPIAPALTTVSADADVGTPENATTLIEVVRWHLEQHPNHPQLTVLSDSGEHTIDYRELHEKACAVAYGLSVLGLRRSQTVALMLPTSPDYFYAFLGVLYAGGVPVPLYPPARPSQIEDHVHRHQHILENAQASVLITIPEAMPVAKLLGATSPHLQNITTVAALTENAKAFSPVVVHSDDLALIQYTSGSTGNPKGVALRHANLLANIRAIGIAVAVKPKDVFVSWLPLYHDMGLISAWLGTQYFGCRLVVMSPLAFLATPERWLQTLHRYRATITAAPNFAYELCLTRIHDEHLRGLDLSTLRFACNGSESVSADTVERFTKRFSAYGFKPTAMLPVYGLAECSVALLCPPLDRGPVVDRIERAAFVRDHVAIPASANDTSALRFVACGRPLPQLEIRIVDDAGTDVAERVEGQLEFRGPSATDGYYRNPKATQAMRHDQWLRTGDRAYVAGDDVYITGRVKDIIIRGGRNIYPQEIEETVGQLRDIRKGCVAAFGVHDPASGTERLIVLAESRQTAATVKAQLRDAASRATSALLGEPPDEVVIAPPRTVLKTSSGKIRRAATKALYEAGLVGAPQHAVWLQFTRLTFAAWTSRALRTARTASRLCFGVYARFVWFLVATVAWGVTAALRSPRTAWAFNRRAARAFFALTAIRISVVGLDRLPRARTYIMVANHSSYLDGLALLATLNEPVSFVAKRELASNLISGVFLRRLGTAFVDRFAVDQSVKDAAHLVELTRSGSSLAFFPEGTFRRQPGLLPFHLGAFFVAVKASVPVVPVALRGTRDILPDDDWLMRPGAITVTILDAISPASDSPDQLLIAVNLRDRARAVLLVRCD